MEHIALVDPFSSTKFLSSNLRRAGLCVSAIYTMRTFKTNYFALQPELFDHTFYVDDPQNLASIIEQLKAVKVTRVYSGNEMSIAIADQLASAVSPFYANDVNTSYCRSNKFEMQEALRRAGLPHIKQIKTTYLLSPEQESELATWQFPVIIKPVNCSGSLGVVCCHTLAEVKQRLSEAAKENYFGHTINYYLVQEYLTGSEYIVDTFSIRGEHQLSGTLRTYRSLYDVNPICLYSEMIPATHPEAEACVAYAKQALTAIGLKNGFAHTEIMLTARGPILIEINPRISGANGYVNKLFQACNLPAQVDLLIASCKKTPVPRPNSAYYGRRVCLQNYTQRIINPLNLPLLRELSSFIEAHMLQQPGALLSKPETLKDTVAFVLLAHEDKTQVLRDYQTLLNWEKNLQLF